MLATSSLETIALSAFLILLSLQSRKAAYTWEIRRERILYSSWSRYSGRRRRLWPRLIIASRYRHGIASTWDARDNLPAFCATWAAWHRKNAHRWAKSPTT